MTDQADLLPDGEDDGDGVSGCGPAADLDELARLVEALLFAAPEPLADGAIRERLPESADLAAVLERLQADYRGRGVHLVQVAGGWAFRTAPDLADRLRLDTVRPKRLTRAALETLAIIAYHQPVSRAEIEAIRGVSTSRGTLDALLEAGWVRPGRRRQTPGRPQTWVTTPGFLDHFSLDSLDDLPGVEEMKAAGLLDTRPLLTTLPGGMVGDGDEEIDLPTLPTNDPAPEDDLFDDGRDDP
ncbi:MAG: SMC-Scp complex subunit ScpB [Rhodospirillaceae bacterium]|nr:SMC-Scp complex subunit ScpB [Rhodospirillaceae bacterium]